MMEIFREMGGCAAVAEAFGINTELARHWTKSGLPRRRMQQLVRLVRINNLDATITIDRLNVANSLLRGEPYRPCAVY
jgi:hypothetical protein